MGQKEEKRMGKFRIRDSVSSTGVMVLISCASCSFIEDVVTLKIIGEWYW